MSLLSTLVLAVSAGLNGLSWERECAFADDDRLLGRSSVYIQIVLLLRLSRHPRVEAPSSDPAMNNPSQVWTEVPPRPKGTYRCGLPRLTHCSERRGKRTS